MTRESKEQGATKVTWTTISHVTDITMERQRSRKQQSPSRERPGWDTVAHRQLAQSTITQILSSIQKQPFFHSAHSSCYITDTWHWVQWPMSLQWTTYFSDVHTKSKEHIMPWSSKDAICSCPKASFPRPHMKIKRGLVALVYNFCWLLPHKFWRHQSDCRMGHMKRDPSQVWNRLL